MSYWNTIKFDVTVKRFEEFHVPHIDKDFHKTYE